MLSSSSVTDSARALAQAALDALAGETPVHASLLASQLGDLHLRLHVSEEVFSVTARGGVVTTADDAGPAPDVRLDTTTACALSLIEGGTTVIAALRANELLIFGTLPKLRVAGEAFRTLIHGLIRAPSGPHLVRKLQELKAKQHAE